MEVLANGVDRKGVRDHSWSIFGIQPIRVQVEYLWSMSVGCGPTLNNGDELPRLGHEPGS